MSPASRMSITDVLPLSGFEELPSWSNDNGVEPSSVIREAREIVQRRHARLRIHRIDVETRPIEKPSQGELAVQPFKTMLVISRLWNKRQVLGNAKSMQTDYREDFFILHI